VGFGVDPHDGKSVAAILAIPIAEPDFHFDRFDIVLVATETFFARIVKEKIEVDRDHFGQIDNRLAAVIRVGDIRRGGVVGAGVHGAETVVNDRSVRRVLERKRLGDPNVLALLIIQ
jgi:hypothetical protein